VVLVGLTGGIGSGKSTVARMLASRGAVILDADVFAKQAIDPGTHGFDRVVAVFGAGVVNADGSLDRAKLADIVFHDEAKRRELEAIVHPEVQRLIAEGISEHAGTDAVVVVDSPLLIETGSHEHMDLVVVVSADRETQIERVVAERGIPDADARARLAAQMPLDRKTALADHVLDNRGSLEDLERAVEGLWRELVARASAERG
jgi:dephospho-CoA kinase